METCGDCVELLPKSLREICGIIGTSSTFILIEIAAGHQIYIPKHIKEDHALSKLGAAAVEKMAYHYGGTFLRIPLAKSFKNFIRNGKIIEARRNKTVAAVAEEFQITERQVFAILQKHRLRISDATEVNCQSIT